MNNSKEKVLFLIPTLADGGGERVVSELSLHFPENIERTIVLFEKRITYPFKGKVRYLGHSLSTSFFLRFVYFFLRFFRFRQVLKEEDPSWVISVGAAPALLNIFCAQKSIVRVENFVSKNFPGFFGALFKILLRLFLNRATSVVVVSKGIRDDLVENFGVHRTNIRVVYNPVALEGIKKLSQKPLSVSHEALFQGFTVIHMGRLAREKGQWNLIRAFSLVRKEVEDVKLIILGEGSFRGYLERMVQDMGLVNDVHFLGWQSNPYMYLANADVFALSSFWEGLPDSLLEAMACGLAVVSSDCRSGPREILAPLTDYHLQTQDVEFAEHGVLVPVCDGRLYGVSDTITREEHVLAGAIKSLLQNSDRLSAYQQKARKRAMDFDIRELIQEWDFLKHV